MLFSFFAMTLYTLCSVRLDLNITVDFDGLSVCVLSECAHMFILVEIAWIFLHCDASALFCWQIVIGKLSWY
jgi:hypothetical protein